MREPNKQNIHECLWKDCSRWRERQVQRPRGRSKPGALEVRQGGQGNWSRVSDRRVWGGEVGEAGKGHAMQAFLDHGEELRVLL